MRKLFLFSFLAIFVIIACSKSEPEPNPGEQKPQNTQDKIEFAASTNTNPVIETDGGTVEVSFNSSTAWSASAVNDRADSWCSVSPASGAAGAAKITVTAKENTDTDERSASVIIKAGNASKTIKVTQKQKDAIILTATVIEVPAEGGEINVEVKSNVSYSHSVSEDGKEWISYVGTKAMTTSALKFKVNKNEDLKARSAMIVIGEGALSDTVKVCQSGEGSAIVVDKKEYKIDGKGGLLSIEVASNVDVNTAIEYVDAAGELLATSVNWLEEDKTKAMSTNTYKFNASPNDEIEDRYARIIFTNKENNLSDTVNVMQYTSIYLRLSISNYNIGVAGGYIGVAVDTDVEYDVIMPSANWITNVSNKNESNIHKFKVNINHSDSLRTSEIVFSSPVYPVRDTLKIFQSGDDEFFLLHDTIKLSYKETVFPIKINFTGVLQSTSTIIDSSCDWISKYSNTKSEAIYATDSRWFKVEENNSESERFGRIIFKDNERGFTDTLIIKQMHKSAELAKNFSVLRKEFTVPMNSVKIPIIIEHNGPYYIDYEEQINSYNIIERESFSDGNTDYYFAQVTEADVPRTFNIYVWNETRSICDTIKVHQKEHVEYLYAADFGGQNDLFGIVVPYDGYEITYSIKTNSADYTLKQKASLDGLLVTPGTRIKTDVGYDQNITTPVNNTGNSQTVTLYFIGENIAYIGEIHIRPKLKIIFDSPHEEILPHSGGQFTTNVWSNDGNLNVRIEGDNTGWLRMVDNQKESREDFTRIVSTFEASPNATGKIREAYIIAYNGFGQEEHVKVMQPSGKSILISESFNYIGSWKQTLDVQLVECDYKVELEPGIGWVKVGQSEKTNGGIVQYLEIEDNAAEQERTATIAFTSDSIVNKLTLVQLPESDALVDNSPEKWKAFQLPTVNFKTPYPGSIGTMLYNAIVKDPAILIEVESRKVLDKLYFSPEDTNIPKRNEIEYKLDNYDGISAFYSGGNGSGIVLSNQYVESYYKQNGAKKLVEENRGVLAHELTHSFQLSPKGVGDYSNPIFHACIEGMADAVRVLNGYFTDADRPKGGSYKDSYRYTGFFIAWLVKNKDKDFLRKFNMSTQYLEVWSFDGAIKYALGQGYNVDDLWNEYLKAMGDI